MKKTNYFSTAIAEWLDELEHMGKDCRTLELDGDRVKLRITPCKLPGNEGGCVALLTVKAGEAGCVSDFLFHTADDVKSIARLADTISAL